MYPYTCTVGNLTWFYAHIESTTRFYELEFKMNCKISLDSDFGVQNYIQQGTDSDLCEIW